MKSKTIIILIISILFISGFVLLKSDNILDQIIIKLVTSDNEFIYTLFYYLTFLGSRTILIPFVLIGSVYLYYLYQKIRPSLIFMSGTLISYLLNELIKTIVQRDRPSLLEAVHAVGYSFPSGHAMISTVCYGLFTYYLLKKIKTDNIRKIILFITISLILLIGFSRVMLNVHYFTDVLGGFLIGGLFIIIYLKVSNLLFIK